MKMKRVIAIFATTYVSLTAHPVVEVELEHLNSGLKGIDCIYVINLKKRPEKWEASLTHLNQFGLTPNRVDAVDGWKIPESQLQRLIGPYNEWMNPGKVGCFLSHLSVLKDAINRDFEMIWVMEDDIEVVKHPKEMIRLIAQLNKIDPLWDILYTDLDTRCPDGNDFRPTLREIDWRNPYVRLNRKRNHFPRSQVSKEIQKAGFRWGMYSMIVSKRGVQKIYNELIRRPLWTPYDHIVHYVRGIREYSSIQRVVTVKADQSISDTKRP